MTCYGDNYCVIGIYMPELPGLEIQNNYGVVTFNEE